MRELPRRKIKFNAWKDPVSKSVNYLSPHCSKSSCSWCKERRARKQRAATAALEAAAAPGMFWDSKVGGHQEQLGPSAPDAWLRTYVKPTGIDVLNYWPKEG